MNKGLSIVGEEIVFKRRAVGEISMSCITKSFRIKFEDVKIIAVSPRLALDDEIIMITLINKNGKFYQFSSWEFGKEPIREFELRFDLNSIRNIEWEKFSWNDHENYVTDKIIYPKELYWKDLFLRPKSIEKKLVQLLKFLFVKKSISGRFSPPVIKYLRSS